MDMKLRSMIGLARSANVPFGPVEQESRRLP